MSSSGAGENSVKVQIQLLQFWHSAGEGGHGSVSIDTSGSNGSPSTERSGLDPEGETVLSVEGEVLYPHQGLPPVLPEGAYQAHGDGGFPLQGKISRYPIEAVKVYIFQQKKSSTIFNFISI